MTQPLRDMEATNEVNFHQVVDPDYKQPESTLTSASSEDKEDFDPVIKPDYQQYIINPTAPKKIRNKRSYKTELRALTKEHYSLVMRTVTIGAVGFIGWALAIWFITAYFIK